MSRRRVVGLILALYPAPWRRRHGEEIAQLLEDLAADATSSPRGLLRSLMLGAGAQRLAALTPAVSLMILASALGGMAIYLQSAIRQPARDEHAAGRVTVQRNRAGRVTAVSGAPVSVVLDPTTHKIVSMHRRQQARTRASVSR